MTCLNGKTIIVTGAARGLGQAIAVAAAREGANLALIDIDADGLRDVVREVSEYGAQVRDYIVDLRQRKELQRAIDDIAVVFRGIDVLVNNAMWVRYEPLSEIQPETVHRMFDVGFNATLWGVQAVTPHMAMKGNGSIINITSPASVHGIPNAAVYCAVKGAVSAFTRQCAVELGAQDIRVNAIAPGPSKTPGAVAVVSESGWEARLRRTPLARLSTPQEIADIAIFLASSASRCITGDVIFGDGGRSISTL